MRRGFIAALLALLLAGCDRRTPTSATPPTPPGSTQFPIPSNALTFILGQSFVFFGTTADYRFAIDTGTERTVIEKATWTVDDTRIARIEPTGRLSAVGYGVTTVRATFQDRQASRRVQIIPEVGGVWEGVARLTRCTGTFCDPRVCRNQFLANATPTITLRLTQRETDITGMFGSLLLTGHTRESGTLVLSGTSTTGTSMSSIQNFAANLDGEFLRGGYTSISEGGPFSFIRCSIRERLEVDREFSELRRTSR